MHIYTDNSVYLFRSVLCLQISSFFCQVSLLKLAYVNFKVQLFLFLRLSASGLCYLVIDFKNLELWQSRKSQLHALIACLAMNFKEDFQILEEVLFLLKSMIFILNPKSYKLELLGELVV